MWTKSLLKFGFIGLLILDLAYSTFQHYSEPLDGDMVRVILPTADCAQVLEDPFGWSAITEGKRYTGVNRYFVHQSMYTYFRIMPLAWQNIVDPIDSIYWSCAFFKILLQILMLWLLTQYVIGPDSQYSVWGVALLLSPLFQHTVYGSFMGIISSSVTYTFFYTFPLALLLLFFLPFYRVAIQGQLLKANWSFPLKMSLALLMVFLSFSGPLIPPLVLLTVPAILFGLLYRQFPKNSTLNFLRKVQLAIQQIPRGLWGGLAIFMLLALYSFYLGQFNAEQNQTIPILQRYQSLFQGLIWVLTVKPGWSILLGFLLLNAVLLKRQSDEAARFILQTGGIILYFSILYLLLLPLGGYREYRSLIVRADTLLPVNLALFYWYGRSTLYLLHQLPTKPKQFYCAGVIALSLLFTIADEPNFGKHTCERRTLERIAQSAGTENQLNGECSVLSWLKNERGPLSKEKMVLLRLWRIIY